MKTRFIAISLLILASISLSSCAWYADRFSNIQQGNILEQEKISKLKIGMSKAQVENLLGTPVLVNTFAPDHWEYVHSSQVKSSKMTVTALTLVFKHDKLVSIQHS